MSETNKAVLRRIYDEVFSQGRLEVVDEVVRPTPSTTRRRRTPPATRART